LNERFVRYTMFVLAVALPVADRLLYSRNGSFQATVISVPSMTSDS
jgi:hypothetical protein